MFFFFAIKSAPQGMDPYLMMKKPKTQNFFPVFYELHMNISLSFLECLVHSSHICKATQRFVNFSNFCKVMRREGRVGNVNFRQITYIMDVFTFIFDKNMV